MKYIKITILFFSLTALFQNNVFTNNSTNHPTNFNFEKENLLLNNNQFTLTYYRSNNRAKVTLEKENKFFGEITYLKIKNNPDWYYLCNLYIEPIYRNKGYAESIIKHIISKLQKKEIVTIFIEPGPFEKINGTYEDLPENSDYFAKLERLKKLYYKCGFILEKNEQIIEYLKNSVYQGHPKYPRYLMSLYNKQRKINPQESRLNNEEEIFDLIHTALAYLI